MYDQDKYDQTLFLYKVPWLHVPQTHHSHDGIICYCLILKNEAAFSMDSIHIVLFFPFLCAFNKHRYRTEEPFIRQLTPALTSCQVIIEWCVCECHCS